MSKFFHLGINLFSCVWTIIIGNNFSCDYCRDISLEDQRLLCSYLPLLREFIPNAAEEIESDMRAHSKQGCYWLQTTIKMLRTFLPLIHVTPILCK